MVNLTQQDQHPEKLICGSILPSNISVHPEHGRIVIEGTVPVRILSLDEKDVYKRQEYYTSPVL